jgi:hypothetical protein
VLATFLLTSLNFSKALPETITPKIPKLNVTTPAGMSDKFLFQMQMNAQTENGVMVTNRKLNTKQNLVDDSGFALEIRSLKKLICNPYIHL